MVELIPDLLSPEIKSQAELKMFKEFKNENVFDRYVVLHSLGMAEHKSNVFGEIDFVVLCSRGVLCIEVKGGIVSRDNGVWKFTNRYGKRQSKTEGPFEQAQGNMQSLRQYLKKRLGSYDNLVTCQYACCVVMPDCEFKYDGIDVIPDILFDKSSYSSLNSLFERSFSYWADVCEEKHGFRGGGLTGEEINRLKNLLRGDFRFVPSLKECIDNSTKALCLLTDEQYEIMESLSDNPRTLVSGVAGAGKTLLAMEQARRAYAERKNVLYICFNHNIAEYAQYQFEKESLNITVKTLHSLMMGICNIKYNDDLDNIFFEHSLPELFLKCAETVNFDYVIIDEGQDLLKKNYLPCIEKLISSNFQNGNWLIFYDPNQNIYNDNRELESCVTFLRQYCASYRLSVNCRNTKQIANANILMTGITNQGKTKVRGVNVEYHPYSNKSDEHKILNHILLTLKNDGVMGSDLIVLSKYAITNPENCLYKAPVSKQVGVMKIDGQMWKAKNNEVRFSTISAYKGLESKVVVLIDVDEFSSESIRLLNYVAVSRACSLLYVLYDKKVEQERQNMIVNSYTKI